MEDLVFLNEARLPNLIENTNFTETEKITEVLRDCICLLPGSAQVISKFIVAAVKSNPEFANIVRIIITENSDDENISLSKIVYALYLGAASDIQINPVSSMLSDLKFEGEPFKKFNNSLETFYCFSILRNFKFYKSECLYRLKKYDYENIISALLIEESSFDISIAIELCNSKEFILTLCSSIGKFKRSKELISLIFICYFNHRTNTNDHADSYACFNSDEVRNKFKGFFTDDIVQYCLKLTSERKINEFLGTNYEEHILPVISSDEFLDKRFDSKKEFFENFLIVSSPSVTHFLSYMEMFKENFILNDDEQELFVRMLFDFHKHSTGFLEIVVEKLLKFGIVSEQKINLIKNIKN